ncbi:MAG: hypothetical protein ACPIOQ_84775, partial [Promethearchaeia archaeon]
MRGTPFAGPRAVRRGGCRAHHGGGGQVRALPRVMRDPGLRHGDALIDHVHIPAGRGPVVLAGRRRVGQRLAHQVQHGPCAEVWPAQARRRRALAVSRAPPGPPPRGEPCLQLRPSVRASGKRGQRPARAARRAPAPAGRRPRRRALPSAPDFSPQNLFYFRGHS